MIGVTLSDTWGENAGKRFEFPDSMSKSEMKTEIRKRLGLPPKKKPTKLETAKKTIKSVAEKTPEFLKGLSEQFGSGQREMIADTSRLLGVQPAQGELTPEAQGFPQKAARLIGGLSAPIGGVPGAGIVPGTIKGILRTRKAYPAIKKALSIPGKALRGGVAFGSEVLSSVPREHVKRALTKDIFKKNIFNKETADREFQRIGKVAQEALKRVNLDAGKEVRKQNMFLSDLQKKIGKNIKYVESRDLDGKKVFISPKDYSKRIDEMASEFRSSNVDLLSKGDNKMLGYIKNIMEKNPEIKDIQNLKKKIQNFSKYPLESIRPPSQAGEQLFKGIATDFKNTMAKISPELGKANIKSSKMQRLRDKLRTEFKDKTIEQRFKNLDTQNITTQDLYKELDEAAPKSLKFMEKAKDLVAQKSFQNVFPGRGGGSGNPEGIKNIGRALLGSQMGGIERAIAFPLMSPKINELLIRGGKSLVGATPRSAWQKGQISPVRSLIKRGATRGAIRMSSPDKNQDGTYTNRFKRDLIREDPRRSF